MQVKPSHIEASSMIAAFGEKYLSAIEVVDLTAAMVSGTLLSSVWTVVVHKFAKVLQMFRWDAIS